MSSEWVEKRFEKFLEREADQKQKALWQTNATEMFSAMFDRLKKQVQEDTAQYNQLFHEHQRCLIEFRNGQTNQFQVVSKRASAFVSKGSGTVINIMYSVHASRDEEHHSLEVVADFEDNGEVKFKDHTTLMSAIAASEGILSTIMC
jgi:hypothetical protein